MYLQKVISRKNCVKNLFFAGILKVNDENSRIRIHIKMSWFRNTAFNNAYCANTVRYVTSAVLIQCIIYACPSGVDGAGAAVAPAAHPVERGGGPVRVRALLPGPGLLQPGGRPRHCRTLQCLLLPLPSGELSQASQVAIDFASFLCFWWLSILLCRRMLVLNPGLLQKEGTRNCPNRPTINKKFVMVHKRSPQDFF